jgi:modification methylase
VSQEVSRHEVVYENAAAMNGVPDGAVSLVVTSPPYPMIEMWDESFAKEDAAVARALAKRDGAAAFEAMHRQLDEVWAECHRALEPGGIACINVGDATRTLGGEYRLYSNHARILQAAMRIGFSILPDILWRKPTNSPNKFLGSGTLPAGAYVTYEHEYVLILRKGPPRRFKSDAERLRRRRSAFFWEERNHWFSDLWTGLRGTAQGLPNAATRDRSAAYPFELAYRLIQMYSLIGDLVLDPFLGTGTTMVAALGSGRDSLGYERDTTLAPTIRASLEAAPGIGLRRAEDRLQAHLRFAEERAADGRPMKHHHRGYDFPVATRQETDIDFVLPWTLNEVDAGVFNAEVDPVHFRL